MERCKITILTKYHTHYPTSQEPPNRAPSIQSPMSFSRIQFTTGYYSNYQQTNPNHDIHTHTLFVSVSLNLQHEYSQG